MIPTRLATSFRTPAALLLVSLLAAARPAPAADEPARVFTVELDRGEDLGQNFGTLFEVRSAKGDLLLGAGFLGAFNTYDRADRHALHVYERGEAPATFEALPRVNGDAGVYLFDRGGRLYARSMPDGRDRRVHVLERSKKGWAPAPGVDPEAAVVADGVVEVRGREVRYKGRTVLEWPEGQGQLVRPYYGRGRLLFWNHFDPSEPGVERLLAWDWRPSRTDPLRPPAAVAHRLSEKGEYPYAVGQLGGDLLVATNLGSVVRLRSGRWETLREPDGKSHQVYCALNAGDALWLGHYPSGELIEYDGQALRPLPGNPPVMPGVSTGAREEQSLTLYGGDVYAGVWPWAELWRRPAAVGSWDLARRMFTRPALTAATTHPYEAETAARGPVANQWGQRVTSLVPVGTDLFISTSAKGSKPWSPEFDFLDPAARDEYGRVYRMTRPGHLAAPLRWTDGPTRLRIEVGPGTIRVYQDDALLGETRRPSSAPLPRAGLTRGMGLYGPADVKALRVESRE
jgi:hypothetical protein